MFGFVPDSILRGLQDTTLVLVRDAEQTDEQMCAWTTWYPHEMTLLIVSPGVTEQSYQIG